MFEQIVRLNNAGVLLAQYGHLNEAVEKLETTLKTKLILDTVLKVGGLTSNDVSPQSILPYPDTTSIQFDVSYLNEIPIHSQNLQSSCPEGLQLFTKLFRLVEGAPPSAVNATIVVNLGLSCHARNRFSPLVPMYYKISMALLIGAPSSGTTKFTAVVLNNLGVWYYDNKDSVRSHFCFRMLSDLLGSAKNGESEKIFLSNVERMAATTDSATPSVPVLVSGGTPL